MSSHSTRRPNSTSTCRPAKQPTSSACGSASHLHRPTRRHPSSTIQSLLSTTPIERTNVCGTTTFRPPCATPITTRTRDSSHCKAPSMRHSPRRFTKTNRRWTSISWRCLRTFDYYSNSSLSALPWQYCGSRTYSRWSTRCWCRP